MGASGVASPQCRLRSRPEGHCNLAASSYLQATRPPDRHTRAHTHTHAQTHARAHETARRKPLLLTTFARHAKPSCQGLALTHPCHAQQTSKSSRTVLTTQRSHARSNACTKMHAGNACAKTHAARRPERPFLHLGAFHAVHVHVHTLTTKCSHINATQQGSHINAMRQCSRATNPW